MKIKIFLLPVALMLLPLGMLNVTNLNIFGQQQPTVSTENQTNGWKDSFNLSECNFSSTGSNDHMNLNPGYQALFEGKENDTNIQLTITVLNQTKIVDGVETRIVEEMETEDGEIVEISENYFAFCKPANDIFYFGEEVDFYENETVVNHEGSWKAGINGSKAGIIMPGNPEVGMKYYQEIAPGVAEDRAEVVSLGETVSIPAGTFDNVITMEETTPLDPNSKDYKYYAQGIGFVKEESFHLDESPDPKTLSLIKQGSPN